jgi:hypothetical protein
LAVSCKACRLPAAVRAELADLYRRQVPLRTIAEQLTAAGHPIHRDAIHRHCRAHVAPADYLDGDHSPAESAAGLMVATVLATSYEGWPGRAARAAAKLRAEGLSQAADVLLAESDQPESMRAALVAGAGTPASELMQARILVKAMRKVLGDAHPEATRALAAATRELGGDDLASALDDLAASVECSTDPEERKASLRASGLRAALDVPDFQERGLALREYARNTGDDGPWLDWLAQDRALRSGPGGP